MTFFKGLSANNIAEVTGIESKHILRALLHVKEGIAQDIPEVFSGTVEICCSRY